MGKSGMAVGEGLFGCGVSFFILSVLEGGRRWKIRALSQDLDGTYADACGIGGVLQYPHPCLGGLTGVEGVPGWGNPFRISARPLCGTAFGSKPSQGNVVLR